MARCHPPPPTHTHKVRLASGAARRDDAVVHSVTQSGGSLVVGGGAHRGEPPEPDEQAVALDADLLAGEHTQVQVRGQPGADGWQAAGRRGEERTGPHNQSWLHA
jgi:hypothetical protein